MLEAAQAGKRITPQQALMHSRKSLFEDAIEMFSAVPDEMLLKALPPELLQRINRAMLGNSSQQQPKQEPKKQSSKRKYRTLDELLGD
jgi:hypothetical protein